MMIVGVLMSAISGGITALAASLLHGNGILHALLSYPLGGMLAIIAFTALSLRRQDAAHY
ncbi:MAG: hypothetical protein U1A24_06260 [Cypionkella sp.]|uniref:hypothetical protein n=1 Tax=Cypionkella sp. TaxID=2811411 RepID=UPI002ABC9819|nr:hypothetical protein [Cypionkella sp.]MDZ4310141.1 hypothetical protein [Cypionkella sp.]